jgi:putative ABC transport system permease protein
VNLTGGSEALRLYAVRVTPEFFAVMGISPAIGAALNPSGRAVVVTHGLWMRRFGSDPGAIGRLMVLDGEAYTLAAVLPESFRFPKAGIMDEPQVYLPLIPNPNRQFHYLEGIGRLKPGVTLTQAQAELDVISAAIETVSPTQNRGEGAKVFTLQESLVFGSRDTLTVFIWAVGLVLLIACANISNLLLSQGVRRQREIAMRSALGATRARMVRQLLAESMVLSFLGGALGLWLAWWGIPLLTAAAPVHTAFSTRIAMGGIQLNWAVLGFTFGVSALAGLLFGIFPALHAVRLSLRSRSVKRGWLPGLLIAGEVALSLVLLVGVGLLMNSFLRLLSVDPGYRTHNLLTIDVELPEPKYTETEKRADFVRQALDRLQHVPGVTTAAAVDALPLTKSSGARNSFSLASGHELGTAYIRAVSAGYFQTMGIPLVRGRLLTPSDAGSVGVVNRAMAQRYWPKEDPIGKVIETPRVVRVRTSQGFDIRSEPKQFEIVGIVGNVRHLSLDDDPQPEIYLPYSQMATTDVTFVLRGSVDAAALTSAAKSGIWAVDRDQPLAAVRTMDQLIGEDLAPRRFVLLLLGVFAVVAVVLAAAGIYGVVLNSVAERTREIGIRMALGARPWKVLSLVLRQGMIPVLAGVGLGVAGAYGVTRMLSAMLYNVRPTDPVTFVCAILLMIAAAAAATYVPARRATRIDPNEALRHD